MTMTKKKRRKIVDAVMEHSDASFMFNDVKRYGSKWIVFYKCKDTILEYRLSIVDDQFKVCQDVLIKGGA